MTIEKCGLRCEEVRGKGVRGLRMEEVGRLADAFWVGGRFLAVGTEGKARESDIGIAGCRRSMLWKERMSGVVRELWGELETV